MTSDLPGTPPLRAALRALMAEHGAEAVQAVARSVAAEVTLEPSPAMRSVMEAGMRRMFAGETTFVRAGVEG